MTKEVKVEHSYRVDESLMYANKIKTTEKLDQAKKFYQDIIDEAHTNGGFVYVKIIQGQKAGSIAHLVFDRALVMDARVYRNETGRRERQLYRTNTIDQDTDYAICSFPNSSGRLRWTGRSNKPKSYLTSCDIVWLKGYTGSTEWVCASSEDIKKEALSKPVQDMGKQDLSVGDSVVYINARYGAGMELCFGIIDRFEAEYHQHNNKASVYTIVKIKGGNQESRVGNAGEFIYKND